MDKINTFEGLAEREFEHLQLSFNSIVLPKIAQNIYTFFLSETIPIWVSKQAHMLGQLLKISFQADLSKLTGILFSSLAYHIPHMINSLKRGPRKSNLNGSGKMLTNIVFFLLIFYFFL